MAVEVRTFTNFSSLRTRDTGLDVNPESAAAHATAMRTVLLYLISDAFALNGEEQIWAGWALDDVCAELLGDRPHTVPLPVRQEMISGAYSRLLEMRAKQAFVRNDNVYDNRVVHATVDEWANALMVPIQASYSLSPFAEAHMREKVRILLSDLGVGNESNPRGATYLPTELRYRVLAERAVR